MGNISVVDLFKAKVHFGHLKRFVCPKMSKYVYSINNKMSIINLDATLKLLRVSMDFVNSIVSNNGVVLFVGTKRQARKVVEEYSKKIDMPYVNFRWLGGILTNYKTIKKSVKKLKSLQEDIDNGKLDHLTKKERLIVNRKLSKLKLNFDGIKDMKGLPDVLFVIDVNYERIAVLEA
ncbi:MAG: 30S ribosomal protein S2, partial [Enterobacteriaceae bacterium]|nr:30S ribosomal protein S2 [Enterobacteriaceae bacterium]